RVKKMEKMSEARLLLTPSPLHPLSALGELGGKTPGRSRSSCRSGAVVMADGDEGAVVLVFGVSGEALDLLEDPGEAALGVGMGMTGDDRQEAVVAEDVAAGIAGFDEA